MANSDEEKLNQDIMCVEKVRRHPGLRHGPCKSTTGTVASNSRCNRHLAHPRVNGSATSCPFRSLILDEASMEHLFPWAAIPSQRRGNLPADGGMELNHSLLGRCDVHMLVGRRCVQPENLRTIWMRSERCKTFKPKGVTSKPFNKLDEERSRSRS